MPCIDCGRFTGCVVGVSGGGQPLLDFGRLERSDISTSGRSIGSKRRYTNLVRSTTPMRTILALALAATAALAQPPRTPPDPELVAKRHATEKQLESIAIIDRKVMVKMQDGKRMAADVYRPKDASKKVDRKSVV